MFRALKDFFKTLKMELGVIGVENERTEFEVSISGEIPSFEDPPVLDEKISVSVRNLNQHGSVRILRGDLKRSDVEVSSGDMDVGDLKVRSSEFSKLDFHPKSFDLLKDANVIDEKMHLDIPKSEDMAPLRIHTRDGLSVDEIWKIRIFKSEYFPKDAVLNVLERFLRRYRGDLKDLKFLGFFKSVPIGRASRMVLRGDSLEVQLKRRGGSGLCVDIVALKTPEGIELEVAGRCSK